MYKRDQKNYFMFRTKKPNLHLDHRLLKLHLLWREFRHIGFHLFFLNVNLLWVWDLLCEMVKIAQQKKHLLLMELLLWSQSGLLADWSCDANFVLNARAPVCGGEGTHCLNTRYRI